MRVKILQVLDFYYKKKELDRISMFFKRDQAYAGHSSCDALFFMTTASFQSAREIMPYEQSVRALFIRLFFKLVYLR